MSKDVSSECQALKKEVELLRSENERLRNAGKEASSSELSQQLSSVLSHSFDLIAFTDLEGNIEFINEAGLNLVGLDEESRVEVENFISLLVPETHERFRAHVAAALEKKVFESDFPLLHVRNGSQVPVHLTTFVVIEKGSPVGLGFIGRDLRELKEIVRQLHQSRKMEALGQLVGGITHDFNNMLAAIMVSVQYLNRKISDSEEEQATKQWLDRVERAVHRAAILTRQLLSFSKGRENETEIVSVNRTIKTTRDLLRRIVPENIELEIRLDKKAGALLMEPSHFEQILINLCLNARDAMPAGGRVCIESRLLQAVDAPQEIILPKDDRGVVCIAVCDDGAGMSKEVIAQMFDPFFSTKPRGKGTGLGLSTVKRIVEDAGGAIRVVSELGKGTTFELFFPVADKNAPSAEVFESAKVVGGTEHILVCEDDEIVRASVSQILSLYGYRVTATSSTEEALQVISKEEGKVDLIVADVIMPGTSGLDFAEIAAAMHAHIKVLFVSGYLTTENLQEELTSSRADFLAKPFSLEALLHATRKLLDKAEEGSGAR